jgi:PAS domain S-box-containing protein
MKSTRAPAILLLVAAAGVALVAVLGWLVELPLATTLMVLASLLLSLLLWSHVRSLRDVEERLRTSLAETTAAEELASGLFDMAPDTVLLVDAHGRVVRMNEQAEAMLGWSAAELVGQPVDVLVPDRLLERHVAGRTGYLELDAPDRRLLGQDRELPLKRRDGTERLVEISLGPMRTPAGLRVIVAVRDVTDRRRAQEELERQFREVEALNRELEAFSYSVSHDLRAPLRAIDGFSRILEEDHGAGLDGEARRLLGVVRERATCMGELIDDLLHFSRLSRQAMEVERVDMEALVRRAVESLRAGQVDDRIELVVGPLPKARGDGRLLHQVWENYLGNAFKFSAGRERPRVEVRGRRGRGEIVYEVRDNGVGFDPAYAGKLFVAFQRLHPAEEFEGTGIGLALAQRIVHRHGGRVWAEGRPDEGATFGFSLPTRSRSSDQETRS